MGPPDTLQVRALDSTVHFSEEAEKVPYWRRSSRGPLGPPDNSILAFKLPLSHSLSLFEFVRYVSAANNNKMVDSITHGLCSAGQRAKRK